MSQIYVLHENREWIEPLWEAFRRQEVPFEEWFLNEGQVDFSTPPPEGVFYNRMSASSHSRGHRYAPELTHLVLNWLESYDRTVVNGTRALYLELSKLAQYGALRRAGVRTPRTVAAVGREQVLAAASTFAPAPFILKPNRGGKGLGVQLFASVDVLAAFLDSPSTGVPIDGVWLVQQYVQAPEPCITRCEFVGGRLLYAVRVDTSQGFELCPADPCKVGGADAPGASAPPDGRFQIRQGFDHPVVGRYERFLAENEIGIAGIEFVESSRGEVFTYDVNTNTNYNSEAEIRGGVPTRGMDAIVQHLHHRWLAENQPSMAVAG